VSPLDRPEPAQCDFEALRSRKGQAEAILVAYDIMGGENGQDVRPEPLEERRKRLSKLLSRKIKAMRDGIQLVRRPPETGLPSFVMRAGWTSKVLFRSASAPDT
jgi:ATP-dependent DNA ligase